MPRLQRERFTTPDEVRPFEHGRIDVVHLDETALARLTCQITGGGFVASFDGPPRAARVAALGGPGEILVSSTTHDLLEGSGVGFAGRGRHALRGLDGERRVVLLVEPGQP